MTQKEFKKTILDILDIQDMPEDIQEVLIDEVAENVLQSMIVYAMENMSEKDCGTLAGYLDKDEDIEKFFAFIEEKVPSVTRVLKSEVLKYAHS